MIAKCCDDSPSVGSPRDRDNRYYQLLAGGARTRLLEAFFDLQLPELLGSGGPLSAAEICERLQLDAHRGWKFLHLLALAGLLEEHGGGLGEPDARFELSAQSREYFGEDGHDGYFYRDLVQYWRNVSSLPLVSVLRGMPLPRAVRWPPPGPLEAEHLEGWMRVTATGAIATLRQSGCMAGARRLLDVGGGDGTIGCTLAREYPELEVTVFNLPASAALARENIAAQGLADRVHVCEGNFLNDGLPTGFDRVLFSRVLTDWAPDVCRTLLIKARCALDPTADGRVVINEALLDGNLDYSLSWEFRYLFYDTFGRAVFKPLAVYEQLLADASLEISHVAPMIDEAFYSVIEARRAESV